MNRIFFVVAVFILFVGMLNTVQASENMSVQAKSLSTFDLQGHRGARGVLPENTIAAFLYALELGVTTLEMDAVINAQGHVVVSHEPWMSASICTHPNGDAVTEQEEMGLRIYAMSDIEVAAYDCGSRGNSRFPDQKKMASSKPLLSDVFNAVAEAEIKNQHPAVQFNIEIKSRPDGDRIFHPAVDEYAAILIKTIKDHGMAERTAIQSFDPRALNATHQIDSSFTTVLLIQNEDGFEKNLSGLIFLPNIYSPYFKLVNPQLISDAHAKDIQVIPWTVNEEQDIREMINVGVDGIITDFPKLGLKIVTEIESN